MTTTTRGPLTLQLNLFAPPLSSSGVSLEATSGRTSRPCSNIQSSAGGRSDRGPVVDEREDRHDGDETS